MHTWFRDSQNCIEAHLLYSVLLSIISKLKLRCIFSLRTWPFYSSILAIAESCEIVKGTGIPCFIVLYCTLQMLHFFNKLKVYGNPVLSKSVSTIFPQHLLTLESLCHTWVIQNFQTFSSLLHLWWWSVLSDYDSKLKWCLHFFSNTYF